MRKKGVFMKKLLFSFSLGLFLSFLCGGGGVRAMEPEGADFWNLGRLPYSQEQTVYELRRSIAGLCIYLEEKVLSAYSEESSASSDSDDDHVPRPKRRSRLKRLFSWKSSQHETEKTNLLGELTVQLRGESFAEKAIRIACLEVKKRLDTACREHDEADEIDRICSSLRHDVFNRLIRHIYPQGGRTLIDTLMNSDDFWDELDMAKKNCGYEKLELEELRDALLKKRPSSCPNLYGGMEDEQAKVNQEMALLFNGVETD